MTLISLIKKLILYSYFNSKYFNRYILIIDISVYEYWYDYLVNLQGYNRPNYVTVKQFLQYNYYQNILF